MRDSWGPPCFPPSPGPEVLCLSPQGLGPEPFNSLCAVLSLCLCSVGGLILDKTVSDPNFAGMAVFTPVINGEGLASAAKGQGRRGPKKRIWGTLYPSGLQQARDPPPQLVRA